MGGLESRIESQITVIQDNLLATSLDLDSLNLSEEEKGFRFNSPFILLSSRIIYAAIFLFSSGPYQTVFWQECDRMNILLAEIVRSLKELEAGLKGQLTMSESMEALQKALDLGRTPGALFCFLSSLHH